MDVLKSLLGSDISSLCKIDAGGSDIEEIRLKRGCRAAIRRGGRTLLSAEAVSSAAFDAVIDRACSHSYHAHAATVCRGYINAGSGIRIGIAGHCVSEDGDRVINITSPDCLTIRIPHLLRGLCSPLYNKLRERAFHCSALIYSPPGIGKTTLLRDLALRLSSPPDNLRTVLADSRDELYIPGMEGQPLLCVYSNYPKSLALEAAIRTMSPDIIICDEIGTTEEAQTILAHQSSGVSIIASAHASSASELLSRPVTAGLHRAGAFDLYCGIARRRDEHGYSFTIETREETEKCLKSRDCVL